MPNTHELSRDLEKHLTESIERMAQNTQRQAAIKSARLEYRRIKAGQAITTGMIYDDDEESDPDEENPPLTTP